MSDTMRTVVPVNGVTVTMARALKHTGICSSVYLYPRTCTSTSPLRGLICAGLRASGGRRHSRTRRPLPSKRGAMQFELTHLVDALPGLGWTALPDGQAEFLNQRWLDYSGLTAEQAAGSGWLAVIHPAVREALIDYWQSCVNSGAPGDTEARIRRYDGVYRWFLFHASPLR